MKLTKEVQMKNEEKELAEIWEKNIDKNEAKVRAERILKYVIKYHPNAKSVLELGVGLGFVLLHFNKYKKFGLDLGKEYIKIARRIVPDAQLFVQSMHNFKIKEKFDVIFTTNECINEVKPYANWELTFSSVYNHLNSNGLFIIEMPTEHYLKRHKEQIVELEKTPSGYIYDKTIVKSNKITWDTVFFKRLKNGLFEVKKDNYDEFIYSVKKVRKSLIGHFKILDVSYFNNKENVILVCKRKKWVS
jgi:SAM-dependent methyltransferase